MKKNKIVLRFIITFLGLVIGFGSALLIVRQNPGRDYRQIISIGSQNEQMTMYVNEEYGFQLEYPESWEAKQPRLPLSENIRTILYFEILDREKRCIDGICVRSTLDPSLRISIYERDVDERITELRANVSTQYKILHNAYSEAYISDVWFGIDSIGADAFIVLNNEYVLGLSAENDEAIKYLQPIAESIQEIW